MALETPPGGRTVDVLGIGLVLLALQIASPPEVRAGAWVEKPGGTYLKLAGETFQSGRSYDVSGQLTDASPDYSYIGLRTYGELGVAPRLGVAWSLPYLWARNTTGGRTFRRNGVGDLDVRVDVQIYRGPCSVAANIAARVPLYADGVAAGGAATASMSGQSDRQRFEPLLGDGSHELTPKIAAGCGFALPGWFQVTAGPNVRFDGFADGIAWSAGGGAFVWRERLAVTLRGSGVERFSSHAPRPSKRYVKASGGLIVRLVGPVSLEGSAGYTIDGAFVARGWSASLGASFQGRLFPDPFG